ncbi:MAG TPA: hypothetical protein VFJ57_03560 [Solirubrobacterales bacterium]|nr:hypothetical protein [Solirubrobacterales bacterium]
MTKGASKENREHGKESLQGALPKGIDVNEFVHAISTSGYPLQITVGTALRQREFFLQEEFAFEDPDQGGRRTVDILGHRWSERFESEQGTSLFSVTPLIECKQSQHPLVLFEAVSSPSLGKFPRLVGYPRQEIGVGTENEPNTKRIVPILEFLGSGNHEFISQPPVAASMSRAVPNGKKVQLSGEETYRAITMPLIKASSAVRTYWAASRRDAKELWTLRMVVPVAVVDCPLIFVRQPATEPEIEPRSWIRLAVREVMSGKQDVWKPVGVEIVDIVQREFLERYLDDYLLTFASIIRQRACEIHDIFLSGSAMIPGLDWDNPPTKPLYQLALAD